MIAHAALVVAIGCLVAVESKISTKPTYPPFGPPKPPNPPKPKVYLRPFNPPSPPPKVKPPPPSTSLEDLVGTWYGSCMQKAVLTGTKTNGLTLISWPPPGSPATCDDETLIEGLTVHFDFNVTYYKDGSFVYNREDIGTMYRKYHYYYGPAIMGATGRITSNLSYPLAQACITIANFTGQPSPVTKLVNVAGNVYTEYNVMNTTGNHLTNGCPGSQTRVTVIPISCTKTSFIQKCTGVKAGTESPPPPKAKGRRLHHHHHGRRHRRHRHHRRA